MGLLQASIFLNFYVMEYPFFCQAEKNYVDRAISRDYGKRDDRMAFLLLFFFRYKVINAFLETH